MTNTERNLRCSTCNCTPSEEIASDPFEYRPDIFLMPDETDPTKMICSDCQDWDFELQSELLYELNDVDTLFEGIDEFEDDEEGNLL